MTSSLTLSALRQSTAEILACAVCDLFPGTQLVNGCSTEIGFYYDFVIRQQLDAQALLMLEERMRTIARQDIPVQTLDMMRKNAMTYFLHYGQKIKADLLSAVLDNVVEVFKMGDFIDICPSPYMTSSKDVTILKLHDAQSTKVYLPKVGFLEVTRISGTAFHDNASLKKFLKIAEKAKKKDHRIIGPEMQLFSSNGDEECWLWHPKGMALKNQLLDWWQQQHRPPYSYPVSTPQLVPISHLKRSKKQHQASLNLLTVPWEGNTLAIGADPTPLHAQIFRAQRPTLSQLPLRYSQCLELCDNSPNNQPWGLLQTRCYSTDITQIFCSTDQILQELISCLQFIMKIIKIFGFEHCWYLQVDTQIPSAYKEPWKKGIDLLTDALKACQIDYVFDNESRSEYGPAIEMRLMDALGRKWKCSSIVLNITCAEHFDLRYQGKEGQFQRAAMITRSIFGSLDRFIAIIVEHYAAVFPLWLAPEQVRVIAMGEKNHAYASMIWNSLLKGGFRASLDTALDALATRVHGAEKENVPYIVIIGDKEEKGSIITVRSCKTQEKDISFTLKDFLEQLHKEEGTVSLSQKMQ